MSNREYILFLIGALSGAVCSALGVLVGYWWG